MAVRKQTDRSKLVIEDADHPEDATASSARASRSKVTTVPESSRAARATSYSKRKEDGDPDTQAKVAAARSRVAAARARKATNETQEDLPAPKAPATPEDPGVPGLLEQLSEQVQRLDSHSEETRQRLKSLEHQWAGLEERLEERLDGRLEQKLEGRLAQGQTRQTEVEVQIAHQGQELLDQRAHLEALNRRLTEQYSSLQREIQELHLRQSQAVAVPPAAVEPALEEPPLVKEERVAEPAAEETSSAETVFWMERCVELEAQQLQFLEQLEAKESEIQGLMAQLETLQAGNENHQLELLLKEGELSTLQGEVSHWKHQVHDFEEALKSREEELSELSSYSEELESSQNGLKQEKERWRGQAQVLERELETAQGELEVIRAELEPLRQQLAAVHGDADEQVRRAQAREGELLTTRGQLETTRAELETTREDLGSLREQLEAAHRSLDERLLQAQELWRAGELEREQRQQQQIDKLRSQLNTTHEMLEEAEQRSQDLMADHEQDLLALGQELASTRAEMKEQEQRALELAAANEQELNDLRHLLASTEEILKERERRLERLGQQLQEAGSQLKLVKDSSQVAQDYETLRKSHDHLKADHEELQQLHHDLREEHMLQTTTLNDERLQLERGLEQARMQLRALSDRYGKQVDASERLVRQLALNDTLLDEAEVVLDALPTPPPSLMMPVRRLRQKISEIRANRQALEGQDFKSYEGRISDLQDELVQTRQKLLEAHSEIDTLERARNRAEAKQKELEKKLEAAGG